MVKLKLTYSQALRHGILLSSRIACLSKSYVLSFNGRCPAHSSITDFHLL